MLDAEIKPYFSQRELNRLAKDAGFVSRRSKLNGSTFLSLMLFHKEELKTQSLNGMCLSAFHEYGIDIKKQSLHERFNGSAVLFLKSVLEKLILRNLDNNCLISNIQGFSRVRIKDSTSFQVGENATKEFPGSGGDGSGAAVRIQFEFDMLTGSIIDLSLNAYNDQDAKNTITTVDSIQANDLVIRDLAYMHSEFLRKTIERKASFVCRLSPCNKVYEKSDTTAQLVPLDFEALYNSMQVTHTSLKEKEVFIDAKNPIKLRLIIQLLPKCEVEKRIARVRKQQAKKKRNEPTKEFLIRCHFNLFLTNTSEAQVSKEIVWPIYKFRWMIELIFKVWKSVWKIHAVKPVISDRLKCYIYSKLITIMTNWNIVWKTIKATHRVSAGVVSFDKCSKFICTLYDELKTLFKGGRNDMSHYAFINTLCRKINQLLIERHRKKETLMEAFVNWEPTKSSPLA
jgi:hypothetical protein